MSRRNQAFRRVAPFAAGALIGTSIVTPVFAATLDTNELQPLVLLVSLVVLLVGLALKAMATPRVSRNARGAQVLASNDMRWRQEGSTIDVALPGSSLRY